MYDLFGLPPSFERRSGIVITYIGWFHESIFSCLWVSHGQFVYESVCVRVSLCDEHGCTL